MSFKQFDGYRWNWTPSANQITITLDRGNSRGNVTPPFGLGNAIIRLNLDKLPNKLVQPITDDSTGQGLIPTSPFGLKRWFGMPSQMNLNQPLHLDGFNGWSADLTYPLALSGSVKQVTATDIIQNGYGSDRIIPQLRIEH